MKPKEDTDVFKDSRIEWNISSPTEEPDKKVASLDKKIISLGNTVSIEEMSPYPGGKKVSS